MPRSNKAARPSNPARVDQVAACRTDMRPVGSGRPAVRPILASASRSMIWLKPFDAPVSR